MGSTAAPMLRTPLILLAMADLAALGSRLRPWHDVASLPGNGTTAYDPAICLVAYIVLIYLLARGPKDGPRRGLGAATMMGLLAGAALAAKVALVSLPANQNEYLGAGLVCAAGILCGAAGLLGARAGKAVVMGLVAGAWSAMTAGLIACAAVLARLYLSGTAPVPLDPWKQYEGLAIGNEAAQALVRSLNTATAFLLIGPLIGGAAGLIFVVMAQARKD